MRSYKDIDEFFLTAMKKKPVWKELHDKVDQLSDKDIDQLSVPTWVKKALSKIKARKLEEQKIKELEIKLTQLQNNTLNSKDSYHVIRKWIYENEFLYNVRGLQFEIQTGDLFAIVDDIKGIIKLSRSGFELDAKSFKRIYEGSESIGEMTMNEYSTYLSDYLNTKHPIPDCIIDLTEISNSPTLKSISVAGYNVRIKDH